MYKISITFITLPVSFNSPPISPDHHGRDFFEKTEKSRLFSPFSPQEIFLCIEEIV